ncbi:hypothetical protein C7999DRAFT_41074 [Corynascus novoguineensis]|uniref:Clr5 domain-containing protein n=1 Tax=Corynascus novoguineensis TaxID=1126955 RepID=A0AAN7CSR4_9PEZI|nr:hypothetical protein C7999DRAFT_41074 [Corynascus novoguineensis]
MQLNKGSGQRTNGQNDVVCKQLPKRPIVPTNPRDWESKKHIIRELYMNQNKILNEVIDIMISKHNFKATARMYKGQFAKWKWTKYNKPGRHGSIRPTRLVAATKGGLTAQSFRPGHVWQEEAVERQQSTFSVRPNHLVRYFNDEERQVEAALCAYGAMISRWSEREKPWRTASESCESSLFPSELLEVQQERSILEQVRFAQDCFLNGRSEQGGDTLRCAFLSIERALSGELCIDALWDCCLAVPQLAITTGWTDVLSIFTRYLHQYTSIKLPHHPIALVATLLHHLCRNDDDEDDDYQYQHHQIPTSTASTTQPGDNERCLPRSRRVLVPVLEAFLVRAWRLWIDTSTRVRGRHDEVTIHLKRGYVTAVDPSDPMAADILRDFGRAVRASLEPECSVGGMIMATAVTTARALELERLLAHMYLPLFTPERSRAAEAVLAAVVARVIEEGAVRRRRQPLQQQQQQQQQQWEEEYLDRYLVFSARNFMAGLAEGRGDAERAAEYRRLSLLPLSSSSEGGAGGRDLFWVQTSYLVESRLRASGMHVEADTIREERVEAEREGLLLLS